MSRLLFGVSSPLSQALNKEIPLELIKLRKPIKINTSKSS
jgi:hypothetical protein